MAHSTHEQLENAEHTQHAAHNPLDRKVAVTMAIIAAFLAAASMVSHRGHNETLRLTTEAGTYHTKEANKWAYYQAKNTLERQYEVMLMEAQKDTTKEYLKKEIDKYKGTDGKEGTLAEAKHEAEHLLDEANHFEHASHTVHGHVNWIDYGHLGLELALILSSFTLLTKQRVFWYSGMVAAVIGMGLVLFGVQGLFGMGHL
jgi:hypothetical protein